MFGQKSAVNLFEITHLNHPWLLQFEWGVETKFCENQIVVDSNKESKCVLIDVAILQNTRNALSMGDNEEARRYGLQQDSDITRHVSQYTCDQFVPFHIFRKKSTFF